MTKREKLIAALAIGWFIWKRKPTPKPAAVAPTLAPKPPAVSKPVPVARIYQKEGTDAYDSVHMSVETPEMPAREMGAFQNRAAAEQVAHANGWKIAQ